MRAAQLEAMSSEHGQESARARDLIALGERFAWRARQPLVIAVCGAPASGKSYLARKLAELSGMVHLSSDITRKRLVGVGSTQRAGAEAYSSHWNARTYAELGRRAAREVGASGGAIVDATFRHVVDRQAFAASLGCAAPVLFIECAAPRSVLIERVARRAPDRNRVSDADVSVVLREQQAWEPLDEVPGSAHLTLRTDRSIREIVGDVPALLERRLVDLG